MKAAEEMFEKKKRGFILNEMFTDLRLRFL